MRARLVQEIGTRAWLRRYWGDDCPNCLGGGHLGYHNAKALLGDSPKKEAWDIFGKPEDFGDAMWPAKCDHCPAPVPEDAQRQVFTASLYDTASGAPEPGDLYWMDCHWDDPVTFAAHPARVASVCPGGWSNCAGPHLHAILPNGDPWDTSGRCSNCDLKDEQTHRCWVLSGTPPNITASKAGHTCHAGAGSIDSGGWHGFIENGVWRKC